MGRTKYQAQVPTTQILEQLLIRILLGRLALRQGMIVIILWEEHATSHQWMHMIQTIKQVKLLNPFGDLDLPRDRVLQTARLFHHPCKLITFHPRWLRDQNGSWHPNLCQEPPSAGMPKSKNNCRDQETIIQITQQQLKKNHLSQSRVDMQLRRSLTCRAQAPTIRVSLTKEQLHHLALDLVLRENK